jgi:tRNA pseudouridine38-40 synthase
VTRFRLTIEYDGRPFLGWQRQVNGATVQGAIEAAFLAITGETIAVLAAGRTDAGVHAEAMVAHADVERRFTGFRLAAALNALLRPAPISIIDCVEAAPDFHARFDCTSRAYRYLIVNRRAPLTVARGLAWQVSLPLDAAAMHDAAQRLVGKHDFTTFRSAHCQAASPVRTLDRLDVTRHDDRIEIAAEARSFLQHQVRSMVGCLVRVGDGSWSADDLSAALAARDRTKLAFNAPPDGLTFVGARYISSGDFTTGRLPASSR